MVGGGNRWVKKVASIWTVGEESLAVGFPWWSEPLEIRKNLCNVAYYFANYTTGVEVQRVGNH